MPKTQRPQQGRQPSKERENYRKNMKTTTKTNTGNAFDLNLVIPESTGSFIRLVSLFNFIIQT